MENTVTISLAEYNQLRDAKEALSNITGEWSQIYYLSGDDVIGRYHVIKTNSTLLAENNKKLRDEINYRTEIKNDLDTLRNDIIHHICNIAEYKHLPWYERIFTTIPMFNNA